MLLLQLIYMLFRPLFGIAFLGTLWLMASGQSKNSIEEV